MIVGYVHISENSVSTHRDSYLLSALTVVSTRRPFLGGAVLLSGYFCGCALAFANLLYFHEVIAIIVVSAVAIFLSAQIGQLSLLSRDLRGSELSGAVWGQYSSLNQVREKIVNRLDLLQSGEIS